MNVVVDALMGRVRTISGPLAPSSLRARLWIHGEPANGFLLIMAVRPVAGTSTWEGNWIAVARPGEEKCIDRERLRAAGVVMPRWRRLTEDDVCIMLPAE